MRLLCSIFLLSIWIGLGEPFCFTYDPNNPWCGRPGGNRDVAMGIGPGGWCSRNPSHPNCRPLRPQPCDPHFGGAGCKPVNKLPAMCNDKFTFGKPCTPPASGPFPCNSKFTDGCKKKPEKMLVDGRSSGAACNDKFTFGKPCVKPKGFWNRPSCNASYKFGCPKQGLGGRGNGGIFDIFGNVNFQQSYKGKHGYVNEEVSEFQQTKYKDGKKIVTAGQKGKHEFADYEPYKSIGFNIG